MEWDWHKLPTDEHGALIAHIEAQRWGEVAKLCQQYEISIWCCCNAQGLQAWSKWAIETGIIKDLNQWAIENSIINGDSAGTPMAGTAGGDGGTVIG